MSKKNNFIWTEELLITHEIVKDKEHLKYIIKTYTENDDLKEIKLGESYPLTKDLGGIPIEVGEFSLKKIDVEYILNLLNSFMIDSKFNVEQNFDALTEWTIANEVEQPNLEICEGYIFNNELINFYKDEDDDAMILQFKYKDFSQNSFILFKSVFFKTTDSYFVFQCRYH